MPTLIPGESREILVSPRMRRDLMAVVVRVLHATPQSGVVDASPCRKKKIIRVSNLAHISAGTWRP